MSRPKKTTLSRLAAREGKGFSSIETHHTNPNRMKDKCNVDYQQLELMSVKLGTELKLNAEITFASSTSKKVLGRFLLIPGHGLSDVPCPPKSPGQRPCTTLQIRVVDMKEKSVIFIGPIKQIKPEGLEKWLRKITLVAFVHIIKKPANG
ncbi:16603_t:CDS:2 [Funneliformis geosporum]|nr:16603_t:CDS:2 [Funneliformis geosporum]